MTSNSHSLSITGTAFAGVYGAVSTMCVVLGLMADDVKSRFVFFQLPIALQMSLVPEPGLRALADVSWPIAYLLFATPTLAVAYLLGAGLGSMVSGR